MLELPTAQGVIAILSGEFIEQQAGADKAHGVARQNRLGCDIAGDGGFSYFSNCPYF